MNMGAAVLILALAANMAAYYFLLRLAFTPERLELEAGKLTKEQIAEIVEAMRIIAGEIVDK